MKRHEFGIVALLVTFFGGCLITPIGEYYLGKAEAYRDISQGIHRGKRCIYWCISADGTRKYERMLVEELKFRVETTESCGDRLRGYNDVQYGRVERIYGAGVFEQMLERVWQDQRREWEMIEQEYRD